VRPVNSGHANRAIGSAQDELLPEVRLASDVGQRLRRTANAIEQGNLLGMIEDEVGWPGFRLQIEISAQQLQRIVSGVRLRRAIRSEPTSRVADPVT
jgi:hypothetical protein